MTEGTRRSVVGGMAAGGGLAGSARSAQTPTGRKSFVLVQGSSGRG
jgi:hypothetical protein